MSPVRTEPTPTGVTFEGAPGYARDAKGELFLLAVANMVGEDTFYEKADHRDERYEALVAQVAVEDLAWTTGFLRWLRAEGNMRSASLVAAAEAVRARITAKAFGGNRQLIDAVLLRADEPGEMLAYWMSRHGRRVPLPVKNGVADAVVRLYTEFTLLKYDAGDGKGFRFGDVIELVHPSPKTLRQGDLFRHAIERRHNRSGEVPEDLGVVRRRGELYAMPVADRRPYFDALAREGIAASVLEGAGMTWEALSGWLNGPMDAAAWSAMAPSMGIFALVRNLRNFDQAGMSDEVAAQVAARIADPAEVSRSRMFPFRWLAAYRNAPSLRWGHALDKALTASLANVPTLPGRTLILVDMSGSMWSPASRLSDMKRCDVAAVFGAALAIRAESATLVSFGSTSHEVPVRRGGSLLKLVAAITAPMGGTDTIGAVRRHYAAHDRVVIVTDEQAMTWGGHVGQAQVGARVPAKVPMYTWNLAGYQRGHAPSGSGNRHTFGGLSDAAFRLIPLLERGADAGWPWEVTAGR
jgi:TROVE domain-containing protein